MILKSVKVGSVPLSSNVRTDNYRKILAQMLHYFRNIC